MGLVMVRMRWEGVEGLMGGVGVDMGKELLTLEASGNLLPPGHYITLTLCHLL